MQAQEEGKFHTHIVVAGWTGLERLICLVHSVHSNTAAGYLTTRETNKSQSPCRCGILHMIDELCCMIVSQLKLVVFKTPCRRLTRTLDDGKESKKRKGRSESNIGFSGNALPSPIC